MTDIEVQARQWTLSLFVAVLQLRHKSGSPAPHTPHLVRGQQCFLSRPSKEDLKGGMDTSEPSRSPPEPVYLTPDIPSLGPSALPFPSSTAKCFQQTELGRGGSDQIIRDPITVCPQKPAGTQMFLPGDKGGDSGQTVL